MFLQSDYQSNVSDFEWFSIQDHPGSTVTVREVDEATSEIFEEVNSAAQIERVDSRDRNNVAISLRAAMEGKQSPRSQFPDDSLYNDVTNVENSFPRINLTELPDVFGATEAEKERFLIGRKGNMKAATKALKKHLQWRDALPLPLPAHLLRYGPNQRPGTNKLPGWIAMLSNPDTGEIIRSKKGNAKIALAFGAMCDLTFDADTYVAATADFMNANLSRESNEKISILVDVRPGKGWNDPAPMKFIPLIKHLNAQFSVNFPERIKHIVIYPMPWWAVAIFNMVRLFMDPKSASKMCMLSGAADVNSPDPPGLFEYIDKDIAEKLNRSRVDDGMPIGMSYYPEGYVNPVLEL